MAGIPSQELIRTIQSETMKAEEKKAKAQAKQGKGFENYGQGVIPENVWKEIKK